MPGRFSPAEYDDVHTRLPRFWQDHPSGSVQTELLSDPNDVKSVVVVARVWFDITETMPRGVGLAQENAGGQGANATSWLENAETSAIGRALANCGYSGSKRPSLQEMEKTERPTAQYNPPPRPALRDVPADGEIKPCFKCGKPVRVTTIDGKQERYNADGYLHFKTCGQRPTGYEAAPAPADDELAALFGER